MNENDAVFVCFLFIIFLSFSLRLNWLPASLRSPKLCAVVFPLELKFKILVSEGVLLNFDFLPRGSFDIFQNRMSCYLDVLDGFLCFQTMFSQMLSEIILGDFV